MSIYALAKEIPGFVDNFVDDCRAVEYCYLYMNNLYSQRIAKQWHLTNLVVVNYFITQSRVMSLQDEDCEHCGCESGCSSK